MKSVVVVSDKVFVPYLEESEILSAINGVAAQVNAAYKNTESIPVLLCTLNGAILFCADLMKRLEFEVELASIKVKSYEGTSSTGNVRVTSALTTDVRDRDVIICEDIVDTGNTIEFMVSYLKELGAKSVRICTMLMKPEAYHKDIHIDFVAKEIPNRFIVGYGLDYNECGRALKDIYVLK